MITINGSSSSMICHVTMHVTTTMHKTSKAMPKSAPFAKGMSRSITLISTDACINTLQTVLNLDELELFTHSLGQSLCNHLDSLFTYSRDHVPG